ncbi:MAG TPA: GtrA family protein [Solirubrobacteraceae bacterium]|nr:GtrA family protein [Solirubrobacteraceae bacterium]
MNATTTDSRLHLARAFLRDIRSPDWGLPGQGFRFALSGMLVALVYVTVTTVLHDVFDVRFQIALATGFVVSVALHFTLQRVFVWRHHERFALAVHHQALRYLCVCATQYGVTALSTSQLPGVLGLPVEVVYLTTMLTIAGINFVLFRGRIFHPRG